MDGEMGGLGDWETRGLRKNCFSSSLITSYFCTGVHGSKARLWGIRPARSEPSALQRRSAPLELCTPLLYFLLTDNYQKNPAFKLNLTFDLSHGDKFFCRTGVYTNGGIKVGFGCAHFHSDRNALNDFGCTVAYHVCANNFVGVGIDN